MQATAATCWTRKATLSTAVWSYRMSFCLMSHITAHFTTGQNKHNKIELRSVLNLSELDFIAFCLETALILFYFVNKGPCYIFRFAWFCLKSLLFYSAVVIE